MPTESISQSCHHGETLRNNCHRSWQKRLKRAKTEDIKPILLKSDYRRNQNDSQQAEVHKCHTSSTVSSSKNSYYSHNISQNVSHFLVLVLTLLTFAHCAGRHHFCFTFFYYRESYFISVTFDCLEL